MALSKSELKKMFLKVLYECRYGTLKGHSPGIDSVVPEWMNKFYRVKLTEDEVQLVYQAIEELRRDGLLVKDSTQRGDNFLVFTDDGKIAIEEQQDPDIYAMRLEKVLGNRELLERCLNQFNDADYETAIFSAYKLLEEKVRNTAEAKAGDYGAELITYALHPEKGRLLIPSCKMASEQEGVYNLFKGAIQFFKNPTSHRTVDYNDRMMAIQVITLADLLLNILSTSKMKW